MTSPTNSNQLVSRLNPLGKTNFSLFSYQTQAESPSISYPSRNHLKKTSPFPLAKVGGPLIKAQLNAQILHVQNLISSHRENEWFNLLGILQTEIAPPSTQSINRKLLRPIHSNPLQAPASTKHLRKLNLSLTVCTTNSLFPSLHTLPMTSSMKPFIIIIIPTLI